MEVRHRWRAVVHRWLGTCDAAVILFERDAVERSEWLLKETTVLMFRQLYRPRLKIVPVFLGDFHEGDLDEAGFGATGIGEIHAVRLDRRTLTDRNARELAAAAVTVSRDELRRHVEGITQQAIMDLPVADAGPSFGFALPAGLLNLAIESWTVAGDWSPLGWDYTVVLHSLERIRDFSRHRAWRARWQALEQSRSLRVSWAGSRDDLSVWRTKLLADPDITTAVLSGPPADTRGRGELGAAICADWSSRTGRRRLGCALLACRIYWRGPFLRPVCRVDRLRRRGRRLRAAAAGPNDDAFFRRRLDRTVATGEEPVRRYDGPA